MTTPAQPAAPVEEPITPVQPSQPEQPQPGREAEKQQAQQPQYVTKEELEQREAELLRRIKQSDRDRGKRIEDELGKIKTLLTNAGTQVTPDVEAKIRNQITDQIDGENEPQPQGQSAVPQQTAPDPVSQFLAQVFARAGMAVGPNDPEWRDIQKSLDDNWNNPNGLTDVVLTANSAALAKKSRTAAMQETAAARVGGGSGQITGHASDDASGLELLRQAYQKR